MSPSFFLAWRHMKSPRRSRAIALTALVASGGIFTGVTALTLILSVMNGLESELATLIHEGEAHVHLVSTAPGGLEDYDSLIQDLENREGIEAVSPSLQSELLLVAGGGSKRVRMQTATLRGMDPSQESTVTGLLEPGFDTFVPDPEWEVEGESREGLVLGLELARSLSLGLGSEIRLIIPDALSSRDGEIQGKEARAVLIDVVDTGLYESNATMALADLDFASEFLGRKVNTLLIRCESAELAPALTASLRENPPAEDLRVESWMDRNQLLFDAMAREKLLMYLFLILTITVASLGIVSTLTLMVSEKRGEIGILRTLGMSRRAVMSMVVTEGFLVGFAGTLLGLLVGWGLGSWFQHHPLPIPWDLFIVDRLPLIMKPVDFLLVAGLSLLVSLLATLYPGWEAARLNPIEAIRKA